MALSTTEISKFTQRRTLGCISLCLLFFSPSEHPVSISQCYFGRRRENWSSAERFILHENEDQYKPIVPFMSATTVVGAADNRTEVNIRFVKYCLCHKNGQGEPFPALIWARIEARIASFEKKKKKVKFLNNTN